MDWKTLGSADRSVRVWDCLSLSCKTSHSLHKNEVNAISLSPITGDLVVSGDKDGNIVVWRTVSDEKHSISPVNFAVYCIACSPLSSDEAAIGYANGMVIILNVVTGSVLHKLGGHTDEVQALSWSIDLSYTPSSSSSWTSPSSPSPSSPSPSSTAIEDTKVEGDKEGTESRAEPSDSTPRHYLASSSRDKTIRIWEAWGVFRCHKELYLPKAPGNMTEQQKGRVWLTVDFSVHNPYSLISSSHAGDILSWNLKDKSPAPHRFSSAHTRSVFNLHHSSANPRQLISISMDRQIVCWDLRTYKSIWRIPGLGGFVYSLDVSPLDPTRVALAVGDNTVRVWITNNRDDLYDSVLLWKGIQSKVSAVSYHPTEVGILGYGLDDGRVGIIDTTQFSGGHRGTVYEISWRIQSTSSDNPTALMYSCGDGIVYEWNTSDFKKVDQPPKNINSYIEASNPDMPPYTAKKKFPPRSDAVWNHAGNLLAVGNGDGGIELFDANFRLVKKFTDHRKLINRIRWNPAPHKSNWFASASDDGTIRVYDVTSLLLGKTSEDSISISGSAECVQVLKGHEQQVSSVAWSPHDPDLLISGSFDATAQVWNVATGQAVANMRGHEGRVFTVGWSPLHPRIVFSAGDDQSARMWDYSTQPDQVPPGKTKQKKKGESSSKDFGETDSAAAKVEVAGEGKQLVDGDKEQEKVQQTQVLSQQTQQLPESVRQETKQASREDVKEENETKEKERDTRLQPQQQQQVSQVQLQTEKKKSDGKSKTAFPHLANVEKRAPEEWEKSCLQVANQLYGEVADRSTATRSIDLFLGREEASNISPFLSLPVPSLPPSFYFISLLMHYDCTKLMAIELETHATQQNWDHHATLEMWKGNVGQALKTVVGNGLLDANWVAFSILAGRDVWESMCVLYAKQLELKSQPHLAACYYLSCHKVREAVEVYRRAMLFRDAVMLAKTRFAISDPILSDLYMAWGQHQEKSGNFIPSAMCYLAGGHPNEAVQMLASRAGPDYLSLASKLARVCRDPLSQALSIAYGMRAQGLGEWNSAKDEFSAHDDLKQYLFILGVEKAWVNYNNQLVSTSRLPRIEQMSDIDDVQLFPKIAIHCKPNEISISYETKLAINFYSTVSKFWRQSFGELLDDVSYLYAYYHKLLNLETNQQARKEKREFLISHKLALALIAQLLEDPSPSASHYLDAVSEFTKTTPAPSPSPSSRPYSVSLLPILLLALPFGELSCTTLRSTTNQSEVVDSLWAFYKFDELDRAVRGQTTIGKEQVEDYVRLLLVEKHNELPKLKHQEAQLTARVVEGELALKRAKGSKSAKKGKSGKTNELKTELTAIKSQLVSLQSKLERLETQPKFPNPEKSSQQLATLCKSQPLLLSYLPSLVEFGVTHAFSESDKLFWHTFSSSVPPSPIGSANSNSSHPATLDSPSILNEASADSTISPNSNSNDPQVNPANPKDTNTDYTNNSNNDSVNTTDTNNSFNTNTVFLETNQPDNPP